jgi:uncharacterized membrane protein YtjA (UPF0391 family)
MLYWTLSLLVISLITAVFGFTNIAADSTRVATLLFAVSGIMFAMSFAFQLMD